MRKVGIITLYYKSCNYGGLLQAYALTQVIAKMGMGAEQISFDRRSTKSPLLLSRKERFKSHPLSFTIEFAGNRIKKASYKLLYGKKNKELIGLLEQRKVACHQFEKSIPHTKTVSQSDIDGLNSEFDAFICGSDQIWNPSQTREAYFLPFASDDKLKIAYAASFGRDVMSGAELEYISTQLEDFVAVSVRESNVKTMLAARFGKTVEWVLDPTLLLERAEWDKVAVPYSVSTPYILSYFLGDNKEQRECVKKFAKKKGLRLLGFPHMLGQYRSVDEGYADEELYDVSPAQFVYLIAHADYVVTDSFHACVFSIIYRKNFVAFERQTGSRCAQMNSRVCSLLKLVHLDEQFVSEDESIDIANVNYDDLGDLERMKKISFRFLENALFHQGKKGKSS